MPDSYCVPVLVVFPLMHSDASSVSRILPPRTKVTTCLFELSIVRMTPLCSLPIKNLGFPSKFVRAWHSMSRTLEDFLRKYWFHGRCRYPIGKSLSGPLNGPVVAI